MWCVTWAEKLLVVTESFLWFSSVTAGTANDRFLLNVFPFILVFVGAAETALCPAQRNAAVQMGSSSDGTLRSKTPLQRLINPYLILSLLSLLVIASTTNRAQHRVTHMTQPRCRPVARVSACTGVPDARRRVLSGGRYVSCEVRT
jgi:hypothetical protein